MQKLIAIGGLFGALLWVLPGCSSNPGACTKESDCGAGEYCALGICKRPLGTTGTIGSGASSTGATGGAATGAAGSGTASGSSTGLGTSTGTSTGGEEGTTAGSTGTTGGNTGSGSTGGTSGGTTGGNSIYCKPCTQQSDCGAIGNICYQLGDGNDYCLTDCSQTATCTEAGADCITVYAPDGGALGQDCYPVSDLCSTANDGGMADGGGASDGGGGDVYCQPCTQNSDCGTGGAVCVSFEYQPTAFCAPDCTMTPCSEATASCDPLNDQSGTSVCAPTSRLCPGGDPYCLVCSVNADCGTGAVCTTQDDFDYFCATTCTVKAGCTEANAECDAIEDVNGNAADGCVPTALVGACPGAPD